MPVSWKAELFVVARMPAEIVSTSGSDVLIFAFPAPFFLAADLTALRILRGRAAFPPISFFLSFFFFPLFDGWSPRKKEKGIRRWGRARKGKERESNLERKFRERRQRRDRPFKLCKWKNGGANRLSYANGKIEELGWLVVPLKGGRVL